MSILQMSKARLWGELLKVTQQQGGKALNPGLSDLRMPSQPPALLREPGSFASHNH